MWGEREVSRRRAKAGRRVESCQRTDDGIGSNPGDPVEVGHSLEESSREPEVDTARERRKEGKTSVSDCNPFLGVYGVDGERTT